MPAAKDIEIQPPGLWADEKGRAVSELFAE
jgi:hypothetical protein